MSTELEKGNNCFQSLSIAFDSFPLSSIVSNRFQWLFYLRVAVSPC
jgi:hypothetical protein